MIPKIIHYCWFGRHALPPLAQKCIESWEKFLPDYEIKEWNEDNFDVNMIPFTKEAYAAKKYAFVSDFARYYILNKYGGIYFDTDVEVVSPLDDILAQGAFMGFERNPSFWEEALVNPGLGLAMYPNSVLVLDILNLYEKMHFVLPDGSYNTTKTVVHYTTDVLWKHGLKDVSGIQKLQELTLYPSDYFAPIDFVTGHLRITKNTRTVHRYMASWKDQQNKSTKDYIKHYIPIFMLIAFNRLKNYKSWRWFR